MTDLNIDEVWDLVGKHYLRHYEGHTKEDLLKQIAMLHQENADLQKERDYLYKHARENVRDIPPDRNSQIQDWIERGVSDADISAYLMKSVSPKIVKNIRLGLGIKKPKGRPKKQ